MRALVKNIVSPNSGLMEIRLIIPFLNVASSWLLHNKVANHNLELPTGKRWILLDCKLLKIKISSMVGACTPKPLHLGSTTSGNPLPKLLDLQLAPLWRTFSHLWTQVSIMLNKPASFKWQFKRLFIIF